MNRLCNEIKYFVGGGRDLATAVNFSKNATFSNAPARNTSSSTAKPAINISFSGNELNSNNLMNINQQQTQPLKHLIPAESILKPFLPKVNTASTRVHPPSTTTNIAAATNTAMRYSSAVNTPITNNTPQGMQMFIVYLLIYYGLAEI